MSTKYSQELLKFLQDNNYNVLPDYPFKHSLDELIVSENDVIVKLAETYSRYCLRNKQLIHYVNRDIEK